LARTTTGRLNRTEVVIRSSDRSDGSLRVTEAAFVGNLKRFSAPVEDVTWLRQVHGDTIVTVSRPGEHAGTEADGAFTTETGVSLALTTADCAPIVMAASDGHTQALAVVHAGWRGLLAGIIEKGSQMIISAVPEGQRFAFCGPCIGPGHYEFSTGDLELIAAHYGDVVRSHTIAGTSSLDLFAGVACALDRSGFPTPPRPPSTAGSDYFSHRTGTGVRKTGRMLTMAHLLHT
jgi:copper oxidase (laccase) domain-containing protein